MGEVGVPDMVTISDIDEFVINKNLKKRYEANKIYVSKIYLYFEPLQNQCTSKENN